MTANLISPVEMEPWQIRHAAPVPPASVRHWVMQCVALCRPDRVFWCSGSPQERAVLLAQPGHHARTPNADFAYEPAAVCDIASERQLDGKSSCAKTRDLFRGSMIGRTMYVVPFLVDPKSSNSHSVGVQVTDSVDLVLRLADCTRVGDPVWIQLAKQPAFTRFVHSIGRTRAAHCHVCPRENTIWSLGWWAPPMTFSARIN